MARAVLVSGLAGAGSKQAGEMRFWTKAEYLRFSEAVMDKPVSFMASRFCAGRACAKGSC